MRSVQVPRRKPAWTTLLFETPPSSPDGSDDEIESEPPDFHSSTYQKNGCDSSDASAWTNPLHGWWSEWKGETVQFETVPSTWGEQDRWYNSGKQLARGQIRGMIGPRRTGRSAMIPGQVARHLIRMSLGQQKILGSGIVPRQRRTSRQIRTSRQHGGLRICARRRVTRRRGLGGHRARLMVEPDPQRLHRTDFGRSLERVDRRLATTVGAHGMTMTARRRLVAGPRQSRSTRSTSFRATTTMFGR